MVRIRLEKINKIFSPNVHVLKDIDLEIKDNEFMVLVGPSGCGKSTCLNLIAGLEFVTDGHIFFDDLEVTELSPKERQLAMVFQSYALYPHMTVRKNMSFALNLAKKDKNFIENQVNKAAKILGIEDLLDRKPKELSGGQRQRVALGRCIVRDPSVFLFDEPLSNLDAKLRTQMRGEIIKLQNKLKTTLVYVTHDQVEAMSMADRITILHDGHIQQVGTPSEVYNQPHNLFVAGFIGSPTMNFIDVNFNLKPRPQLLFKENSYMISEKLAESIQEHSLSSLILGIRPEHIDIRLNSFPNSIEVKISVVEYLGSETVITFEFPGEVSAMAVHSGFFDGKMGGRAYIKFEEEDIRLFHPKTQRNILYPKESFLLSKNEEENIIL